MTDPKKKRPTPTGAWVTVNNPDPYPRPVVMSRPIRATVRVDALHLGTQTAAELAAAKIHAAVRAQIEDALPGITPEDAAQLLKVTERELQVTTRPDGSVSMTIAFDVVTHPHALDAT